jgi:hypothetical protein
MGGGGDYSVFAGGHYQLSNKIYRMIDWLKIQDSLNQKKKK